MSIEEIMINMDECWKSIRTSIEKVINMNECWKSIHTSIEKKDQDERVLERKYKRVLKKGDQHGQVLENNSDKY